MIKRFGVLVKRFEANTKVERKMMDSLLSEHREDDT
jgi:hypothetical protein